MLPNSRVPQGNLALFRLDICSAQYLRRLCWAPLGLVHFLVNVTRSFVGCPKVHSIRYMLSPLLGNPEAHTGGLSPVRASPSAAHVRS